MFPGNRISQFFFNTKLTVNTKLINIKIKKKQLGPKEKVIKGRGETEIE